MLYRVIQTAAGYVGIMGANGRASELLLPRPSHEDARRALLAGKQVECVESEHDFRELAAELADYFAGKRVLFKSQPDLQKHGAFDQAVWSAAQQIPYGETRSYRWVAEQIGKPGAARAVGQAMGRNPVPVLVPCHRVIRSDGSLGGFGAGIEWKWRLLELEQGKSRIIRWR